MDDSLLFFRQVMDKYTLELEGIENIDKEWKIQTDKGEKRVTLFNSQQQLALSHGWRECLADHGYRYVERYYATVDGKRWLTFPSGLYAVSDFWAPGEWPQEKKMRMEGYGRMGEILAHIHSYFEGIEENSFHGLEKKGILSRVRFSSLYDFLRKVHADSIESPSTQVSRLLSANLPLLGERIHRAELFYQKGLSNPLSFSFTSISLDHLILYKDKWYFTGLHHSFFSPRHEDTFTLLLQIFRRENGDLKGIESFLKSYMSHRFFSPQEWDYLFSILIFPWETVEQLYTLFTMKNLENISVDDLALIFQRQGEQESILRFIAHWADLRDGVSL